MKIINLWGAPSSGKSTTAAGLFFLMKINKEKVELVTEYAKNLIWSERHKMFDEQIYLLSKQNHLQARLAGKVDWVITDSPLPLSIYYAPKNYLKSFPNIAIEQFNCYDNVNILLKRTQHTYENFGRRHSEQESGLIHDDLVELMNTYNIQYIEFEASPHTPQTIFDYLQSLKPEIATMTLVDNNTQ